MSAAPPPGAEPRRRLAPQWLLRLLPWSPLAVLGILLLVALLHGEDEVAVLQPREAILHALRIVESGDRDDAPDGDDGRAIGPYQIHRRYWQDAVAFEPALDGDWQDCRKRDYAERAIDAYMRRWVPEAWASGHAETIARVHNGGPEGPRKEATERYWRKVRAALPRVR